MVARGEVPATRLNLLFSPLAPTLHQVLDPTRPAVAETDCCTVQAPDPAVATKARKIALTLEALKSVRPS